MNFKQFLYNLSKFADPKVVDDYQRRFHQGRFHQFEEMFIDDFINRLSDCRRTVLSMALGTFYENLQNDAGEMVLAVGRRSWEIALTEIILTI